ncbi:MAG TPA: (2Fe-2S) ferredoxin domain-containing protein [Thermotoga sp.]|nr:(2Fe-2S) ferredoxin domain-containing protein [Thermotoga sp.]
MKKIYVCMGSACHLKGGEKIVKVFLEQIKRYNLSDKVEIKGSFCLGPCAQAVAVKVDDKIITKVSPENAAEVFKTKILPMVVNEKGEDKT